MKVMELQGVVRGKKVITTNPDAAQPRPDDKVNRIFVAQMPNQLWVSDFTYVSSWQGMVYVAPRHGLSDQWRSHGSIIDVFARKIVGWRVSTSMTTVRDRTRTMYGWPLGKSFVWIRHSGRSRPCIRRLVCGMKCRAP
ncbi:MAG TPA: hypothetical protein GX700_07700 [Paracoccus sp.]|nr:hypothetical protein [Paracoccus sp. (in: a-proteobacteria)]